MKSVPEKERERSPERKHIHKLAAAALEGGGVMDSCKNGAPQMTAVLLTMDEAANSARWLRDWLRANPPPPGDTTESSISQATNGCQTN